MNSSNFKVNSYILLTCTPCFIYIQLACVKHIASVHPEPGSNPLYDTTKNNYSLKSYVSRFLSI